MLLTAGGDPPGFRGLRAKGIYLVLCEAEEHLAPLSEDRAVGSPTVWWRLAHSIVKTQRKQSVSIT